MTFRTAIPLAMLALLGAFPAAADQDTHARLLELETQVKSLQARVTSLEAQAQPPSPTAESNPTNSAWRKLKQGMTEANVEQLLGSPTKVVANPVFIRWVYGDGLAHVMFDSNSHTVEGWSEP